MGNSKQSAKPDNLNRSLQYEHGVGAARAMKLAKIGIRTARDLLLHIPRKYVNRTLISNIIDLKEGEEATIRARIIRIRASRPRRGPYLLQATLEDESGVCDIMWFNQKYLADILKEGLLLVITGKPKIYRSRLQIVPSEYEIIGPVEDCTVKRGSPADLAAGRIVPYYPLTDGISQRLMRSLAYRICEGFADSLPETLSEELIKRHKLMSIGDAIRELHFPSTDEKSTEARRRMVYDELLVLQLGLTLVKAKTSNMLGRVFDIDDEINGRIRARFGFELTGAQNKCVAEISADMRSGVPMHRLLQGDVGSGKTAVAVYAMLGVVARGAQAAVMAPTELLAAQHAATIQRFMEGSRVKVSLLKGKQPPQLRREIQSSTKSGETHIVVGTHALLQKGVEFKDLGLILIDEQHKFGVEQRADLAKKGNNPHVLVMTATPIPRTLALAFFGDLDLSVIDELPPGRGVVTTEVIEEKNRGAAYKQLKELVKTGQQGYVVCPRVEGDVLEEFDLEFGPEIELQAAVDLHRRLGRGHLRGIRLGLLHGRMDSEAKAEVMAEFKEGKIQVLVCTVVIEVGIDVPNATAMIIEHADRFGLSQLHQLRGRISRGENQGRCLLVAKPKTEEANLRLEAMVETSDGFKISEADFGIRGPGEFFGRRQSGVPELRFADIFNDSDILKQAHDDAVELIIDSQKFNSEEYIPLRRRVAAVFKDRLDMGGVA